MAKLEPEAAPALLPSDPSRDVRTGSDWGARALRIQAFANRVAAEFASGIIKDFEQGEGSSWELTSAPFTFRLEYGVGQSRPNLIVLARAQDEVVGTFMIGPLCGVTHD